MLACFAVTLTLVATALAQRATIDVYVGGTPPSAAPTKIKMRYNIAMKQTILSSRDFNCTADAGCTTDFVSNTIKLSGVSVQYYVANLALNLINQQFNDTMTVYYIYNDTNKLGSYLGLAKDSVFLNYYSNQNQKAGFKVAFNLDSTGDIDFHPFVGGNYTLLNPEPYVLTVTTKHGDDWKVAPGKLCFLNTIDDDATNSSIIGVPARNYTTWYNFFKKYYEKEIDENYFYMVLADTRGVFAAQMNYLVRDFTASGNPSSNVLSYVRSLPNEYADSLGCDFFTGNMLLQKFDFHLVYTENDDGYDYKYAIKSPSTLIAPPKTESKGVSGWIVLLVLIILGAAGYFIYQWYLNKQRVEAMNGDGYVAMQIAPVEMNDVNRDGRNQH